VVISNAGYVMQVLKNVLRHQVHHAKSFNDMGKENNITTINKPQHAKKNGVWIMEYLCVMVVTNFRKTKDENKEHFCITYLILILNINNNNNRLWQQHVWLALLY
jgi:hypothetical protein